MQWQEADEEGQAVLAISTLNTISFKLQAASHLYGQACSPAYLRKYVYSAFLALSSSCLAFFMELSIMVLTFSISDFC